ncbi:MAG: GIY-YIG nuclease family protein [Candidatus Buchananbacteria bacterium]
MSCFVYAIKSESTGKIYIGFTDNLELRLKRHNNLLPHKKSSYTFRNKGPWKLIYQEKCEDKKTALLREKQLKSAGGREFIKNL